MANEKRLISLDDALEALNSEGITKNMRAHRKVAALPTVDAVEVVHCCDCLNCTVLIREVDCEPLLFCEYWKGHPMVDPTDFCSYGERREDNA